MDTRTGLRASLALLACTALVWAWRSAPPALTRGPYLQATSETGLKLVCKTATATTARLTWGRRAGPPWEFEQETSAGTTHVFTLTGLRPETRYVYELSAGGSVVASGADCAFRTSPPDASRAPFRFVAWGDSGTGSTAQLEVAARLELVQPQPSFALGLGDLVYDNGEWEKYDPRLFTPYAALFRRATFWPTLGNHDVGTENGAPFLDAFYLPTTTGAPGSPSNSEKYYSFEHGQAHFVCLDSQSTSSTPGGAMYDWLAADLDHARARGKRWLFVFMHHPPYTHGTHDSDSESDLRRVHDDLVPLFEAKGVDMVLTGHSHVYERSFLAKNDAILQPDPNDYSKIGAPDGTLYLVTGCGGKTGSGTLDHPLMARSYGNVAGFNVIDVSWEAVQASFVERDGRTTDLFRIRKANDTAPPRLAQVRATSATALEAIFDEPVQPGSASSGAENATNWALSPAAAVLTAQLDSDQRTVRLTTTTLAPDLAHELEVQRVADLDGNAGTQTRRFVRGGNAGGTPQAVVPQGASWRYAKGSSTPAASWAELAFDDSAWSSGAAGFGFGDGDDATVLGDMLGNYASVYVRTDFDVADPARVSTLALALDFDDGFVAYLNGSEVARDNVPLNQTAATLASGSHEAGTFETFDLSPARGLLRAGRNVLAVEGHNASLTSNDFSLHPSLLLSELGAGGPPVAVIESEVHTATAPVRIAFSGARSTDEDGPLASLRWDFGDGSALVSGTTVEHLFDRAGLYAVTLTVTDGDGLQALDELVVRIHAQGSNPVASFSASTTTPAAGASVSFASGGSLDPDGGTVFRAWDFGDPSSAEANHSTLATPTHVFESAGSYTVTLTVVDDEGSTSTQSTPVSVGLTGTAPTARFSARVPGADPLERAFSDLSSGDVTSWSWDFGDGAGSSAQNPSHVFAAAGSYAVVLTVSGPSGSDDVSQTLNVGTGGGSGSGGGGCSVAPDDGRGPGGDPSLALALAAVLVVLALRARGQTRPLARARHA